MAVNISAVLNDLTDAAAAQDADAGQALILTYEQTIGRPPTAAELTLGLQQLQDGTPLSALRDFLATTGYATVAVSQVYTDVVGRAVTAPELASDEQELANGGSLAGLRSYLATTKEADGKLEALCTDVVGRAITMGELTGDEAAIGAGATTLAGLRSYFATTNEAEGKLKSLYADVVGRAATRSELTGGEAAIGAGTVTLGGLRGYFAGTDEAAGKLQSLYSAELGRAITPGELAADQQLIAGGSSLAAIRSYFATSAEVVEAFYQRYYIAFSDRPPATDLLSGEQALAGGADLASAVVGASVTAPFIYSVFESSLGMPPGASEVAAAEQDLATKLRGPDSASLPPGAAAVATIAVAAASPEFTNAINAAFQAAIGRPANAVELAAERSELSAGLFYNGHTEINLTTLKMEIAELSGGPPPQGVFDVYITPQTIAGSPGTIYGLLNNDALTSSSRAVAVATLSGGVSVTDIFNFNPATDVIQIESRQAASFSALRIAEVKEPPYGSRTGHDRVPPQFYSTDTQINLGNSATIILDDTPLATLTAANFHFV